MRKPLRLPNFDYSSPGAYFVTITIQNRALPVSLNARAEVDLSPAGRMVDEWWSKLPDRFPRGTLDAHRAMPDHFHGIVLSIFRTSRSRSPPLRCPTSFNGSRRCQQTSTYGVCKRTAGDDSIDTCGSVASSITSFGANVRSWGFASTSTETLARCMRRSRAGRSGRADTWVRASTDSRSFVPSRLASIRPSRCASGRGGPMCPPHEPAASRGVGLRRSVGADPCVGPRLANPARRFHVYGSHMASDLRVALRLLWKDKAFSLTAALTLAVCIGANTALFSVVHNVLLRPLPIPESGRIVLMANAYPGAGFDVGTNAGVPAYYDRLRDTTVFEEQALYNSRNQSVDQNGSPVRVRVTQATPSFFRLLRAQPFLGRTFVEQDGELGNEKKAVLSYALWQTVFGGNRAAVGTDIRLDGQPYTVVGVMPQGFYYLNPNVMLWTPLAFTARQKSDESRHSNNYKNFARLKPGATIEQARQQVDAINTANLERFPQYKELLVNARFRTTVDYLQDTEVRDVKATLYLMWGGALFVLLIGIVNVANLVLVRSRARLKELATRLALGAGRLRVGRQLVTESVLLTMVAAAAGLLVGYAALRLPGTLNLQGLPRGGEVRLDRSEERREGTEA